MGGHPRGAWAEIRVLPPTAEVEQILLVMEHTNHTSIAAVLRTSLSSWYRVVRPNRNQEIQVDVPVPADVWAWAGLEATKSYQLGWSPEAAFHDAMTEEVPVAFNNIREGTDPKVPPLSPQDLPIDREGSEE